MMHRMSYVAERDKQKLVQGRRDGQATVSELTAGLIQARERDRSSTMWGGTRTPRGVQRNAQASTSTQTRVIWWPDSGSDAQLLAEARRRHADRTPVIVLRNLSTPPPSRATIRELHGIDTPVLVVADGLTLDTPLDILTKAVKSAWSKYRDGRKRTNASASFDASSETPSRAKVGRGPLTDEQRQAFKDAFLGRVPLDDGIR